MQEPHYFLNGGRCVWCQETQERVHDRKAPPYCPQRPEELCDDGQADRSFVGGY